MDVSYFLLKALCYKPAIYLFVYDVNKSKFNVPFEPDPKVRLIETMNVDQFVLQFNAFPLVSIIPRTVSKTKQGTTEAPFWLTQVYLVILKICRFCKEFLISNQLCQDIYVCMYLEYNLSFQSYTPKNLLSSDYQILLTPSNSFTQVGLFILPGNCFFTLIKQQYIKRVHSSLKSNNF